MQRTGYQGETQHQLSLGERRIAQQTRRELRRRRRREQEEEENAKPLDRCEESLLVRFPDVSCIGCLGLLCSLIAIVSGCVCLCVFSVNLLDFLEFRFEGFGGVQVLGVCIISFCASASD